MAKKSNSEQSQTQLHNPFTENFMPHWEGWKAYKKEQFKFVYKPIGEQAAIDRLHKLSNGNEAVACEIIAESKANGWKGFFELKPPYNNGKINQGNPQKPTPAGNVAPGGFGQF